MTNMLFIPNSGEPIKNASSISFGYGKTIKHRVSYNNISLDINNINDKYSNRFDSEIIYDLWSSTSQEFIPPTPSITPSNTATPTVTPSITPTISITPSITSSITPTTTPTLTTTNSLSISPTPTLTNTATTTQTAAQTSTPTPTSTTTPTPTPTSTTTPTITSTSTPTPTVTPSASSAIAITTNSANYNGCANTVSSVGTNGRSSYYGSYDMSGNVWEWNDTSVGGSNKVFRGGNWGYDANYLSSFYRNYGINTTRSEYIGFRISSYNLLSIYPNMVYVTDNNNNADSTGFGSVNYNYYIGRYEITNSEYVEFLNSVAQTDTYALYINNMSFNSSGGITRTGSTGSFIYTVKNNMGNKPVNFVNWFNCARFCNWLHNGKPTGSQNASTTENGSYDMTLSIPVRTNNASIFIPNEDEWYKAAYYKGGSTNAGYWLYATQSNTAPNCVSITSVGDGIPV